MGAEWYNRASICWPHRGASVGRSPCTRLLRLACRPTSHIRPLLTSRRPGCARHAALRCRARRRGAPAPPGGHRPKLTVPAVLPDARPSLSSLLEPRCHGDRGHTQRRGVWALGGWRRRGGWRWCPLSLPLREELGLSLTRAPVEIPHSREKVVPLRILASRRWLTLLGMGPTRGGGGRAVLRRASLAHAGGDLLLADHGAQPRQLDGRKQPAIGRLAGGPRRALRQGRQPALVVDEVGRGPVPRGHRRPQRLHAVIELGGGATRPPSHRWGQPTLL